jgi:putative endonuclease
MSDDLRHHLGALGERVAAEHLLRRGYRIVERNYRTRWGELDIIAFDGEALAFCEVKTRRASSLQTDPLEAVRTLKRGRIRKMAGQWLIARNDRPHADVIRFDAIGVTFDAAGRLVKLEHLENAF